MPIEDCDDYFHVSTSEAEELLSEIKSFACEVINYPDLKAMTLSFFKIGGKTYQLIYDKDIYLLNAYNLNKETLITKEEIQAYEYTNLLYDAICDRLDKKGNWEPAETPDELWYLHIACDNLAEHKWDDHIFPAEFEVGSTSYNIAHSDHLILFDHLGDLEIISIIEPDEVKEITNNYGECDADIRLYLLAIDRLKKIIGGEKMEEKQKTEKRKTKKILWLSRHQPLQAQIEKLEEIFGNVQITIDPNPFDDVDDIMKRLENFDDLVIVAPLSVIHQLTLRGVKPIWAEMRAVKPEEYDPYDTTVNGKGRYTKFQTFKRIQKVELIMEDLEKENK